MRVRNSVWVVVRVRVRLWVTFRVWVKVRERVRVRVNHGYMRGWPCKRQDKKH